MKKFIEKGLTLVVFAMIGFFLLLWCAIEVEGVFGVELLIRLCMFLFIFLVFVALFREAWRNLKGT